MYQVRLWYARATRVCPIYQTLDSIVYAIYSNAGGEEDGEGEVLANVWRYFFQPLHVKSPSRMMRWMSCPAQRRHLRIQCCCACLWCMCSAPNTTPLNIYACHAMYDSLPLQSHQPSVHRTSRNMECKCGCWHSRVLHRSMMYSRRSAFSAGVRARGILQYAHIFWMRTRSGRVRHTSLTPSRSDLPNTRAMRTLATSIVKGEEKVEVLEEDAYEIGLGYG